MGLSGLLVMALLLPTETKQIAQAVFSNAHNFSEVSPLFDIVTSKPIKQQEIASDIVDKKPFAPIETATNVAKTVIDAVTPKKKESTTSGNTLTANNIIDATNKERVALGLVPLVPNEKLSASAKIKTDDMIKKGYFEHVSPSGVTVSDLGNQVGYNYVIMGENLALGNFTGADDLVDAWMKSPGHRANIVNTSYMEIGIYAAQGEYQGRKVWFAVQHFGTTRGACPVVSTTLKTDIDVLNRSLKTKEKQIITLRTELEATSDKSSESYATKVATFNSLVASYNSELAISQQSIGRYNKQVVAFNACLSKYQKAE